MLLSLFDIFKIIFHLQLWKLRFGDNFYFYKILYGFNQYYGINQQVNHGPGKW